MGGKIDPIVKAKIDGYFTDLKRNEEGMHDFLSAMDSESDYDPIFKDILGRYVRKKEHEHRKWQKAKGYK